MEGVPPTKWGRDDQSHHRREGQEGSESLPGVGEGPDRGRVALSELTGLEGLQGLPCGLLAGGLVDRPESRCHGLAVAVEPRVLWRLVYLVPVVAGCDCSWRWRSGAQAASCSAGVRIPMAECGRVVPVPVDLLGGGEHGRR